MRPLMDKQVAMLTSVSGMTDFSPRTRFKVSSARPIILAKLDVPLDLISAKTSSSCRRPNLSAALSLMVSAVALTGWRSVQ